MKLTPTEFRSIMSLGIVTPNDTVTPIITGVHITVTAGVLGAIATDKYRIARLEFPLGDNRPTEDFEITISAKALTSFWAANKVQALKGLTAFELTVTPTEELTSVNLPPVFTLSCEGNTVTGVGILGQYPPVGRLMEGYDLSQCDGAPSLMLRPVFLGDLAKIFHPGDDARETLKETAWEFRFKPSPSEGKLPAPVYVTRHIAGHEDIRLDYLVQPNKRVS